jgi:glutathione-independent formaldehyde dehydrogenase
MLRGAAEVYVVDCHPDRLHVAQRYGAIPIDFTEGSPVEQIRELRLKNPLIRGAMRPGEEKMSGVMCGIDAVGYQALAEKQRSKEHPTKEKPAQVLEWLAELVNPTGRVGAVGVYLEEDPGGVNAAAKKGVFALPFAALWEKGIQVGTGQTPVKRYVLMLRDLVIAGRAKPSLIVSHRLPLTEAPRAYARFDERADGFTKVILKPHGEAPGALA